MKIKLSLLALCLAAAPHAASAAALPVNSLVSVTPMQEISSKRVEEGDVVMFTVVNEVVDNGTVVIPRGAVVKGTVTWKTGRAIMGKSGKFEVTFNSVNVGGREWSLRGTVKEEGKGNTAAALLATWVITGRSAVLTPGEVVNCFTAEQIVTS